MSLGFWVLLGIGAVLFAITLARSPEEIRPALTEARDQFIMVMFRIPLAIVLAAFLGLIIPPGFFASIFGTDSGLRGLALAACAGAVVPGGPAIMFPLALVVWRAGAGEAQMVTFLTAWTVIAVHRMLLFELPLLGRPFVQFRLISSWFLPIVAGVFAMALIALGFG